MAPFPPYCPRFLHNIGIAEPGEHRETGSGRRIVARQGGHLRQVDAILFQLKPSLTTEHGNHRGAFHTTEEE